VPTTMDAGRDEPSIAVRRSRPLSVTLLALGVLTLAGINLLRFVVSLQQWSFLSEILSVSPLYLAGSGLVWALVGLTLALGIWFGRRWSVLGAWLAGLAYSLYFWLDRLLVAAGGVGSNWLFALELNLFLLVLMYVCLANRKAKDFFGDKHDGKPED
jgi:hypothetical protein